MTHAALNLPPEWTFVPGDPPSWRRVVRDKRDICWTVVIWRDDWDGGWKCSTRSTGGNDAQDLTPVCSGPEGAAAAFEMLDPMNGFKPRVVKPQPVPNERQELDLDAWEEANVRHRGNGSRGVRRGQT